MAAAVCAKAPFQGTQRADIRTQYIKVFIFIEEFKTQIFNVVNINFPTDRAKVAEQRFEPVPQAA